jgi:glycosyltransferase involved in cell wall biosynthesis
MRKNKKLVFVNQHYYPDNAATALALTDLAEWLAERDYEVRVVCSQKSYDGTQAFSKYEQHNGVHIHRVPTSNFGRSAHLGRFVDYATFFFLAFVRLLQLRFDVLITLTTPPLLGFLHTLVKPIKGCKSINWFMDLHPDAEMAHDMINEHSFAAKILRSLHHSFCYLLDDAVVLSQNMRNRLTEHEPFLSPTIHRIWTDEREVKPMGKQRAKNELIPMLKNDFIIHYSGNMGIAHDFLTMLQVARRLKDNPGFQFVFTGGGPQSGIISNYMHQHQLTNITMLPYVERNELARSLAKADVHWVSLRPAFDGVAFPSKTYGYMASARPIIFIGSKNSDTARDIKEAGCGCQFDIDAVDEIYDYLLRLRDKPRELEIMGHKGYEFFRKKAARDVVCARWQKTIELV